MWYRGKNFVALFLFLFLAHVNVQAQEVSGGKVNIQISSCTVYSVKDSSKSYNCLAEAKKALGTCSEAQSCEIPIGLNLTSGVDIAPGSGFLGKQVKIMYLCGKDSMQGGPYQQDDHASLVLDCSGMWW